MKETAACVCSWKHLVRCVSACGTLLYRRVYGRMWPDRCGFLHTTRLRTLPTRAGTSMVNPNRWDPVQRSLTRSHVKREHPPRPTRAIGPPGDNHRSLSAITSAFLMCCKETGRCGRKTQAAKMAKIATRSLTGVAEHATDQRTVRGGAALTPQKSAVAEKLQLARPHARRAHYWRRPGRVECRVAARPRPPPYGDLRCGHTAQPH